MKNKQSTRAKEKGDEDLKEKEREGAEKFKYSGGNVW